jgi:hypothetical protein
MPIAIAPSDIVESPGVARVGDADAPQPGLFDGRPVADGDVVVRFTWPGDVNLNGNDDQADLSVITAATGTGWSGGDVNYDGSVDGADYSAWADTTGNQYGFPAVAESGVETVGLSGDGVLFTDGLVSISSWTVKWGDGTNTTYPVAAGASPDVSASHTYASTAVGEFSAAVSVTGVDVSGAVTTLFLPHQDVVVTPDAPTDLSATESTTGEVDLSWADDTAVATGYVVTATPTDTSLATKVYDVPAGTFNASATGLTPDAVYAFNVVAVNTLADGVSSSSSAASATATAPGWTILATPGTVAEGATAVSVTFTATNPAATVGVLDQLSIAWSDSGTSQAVPWPVGASSATVSHTITATETSFTASAILYDVPGNQFMLTPLTVDVVPTAPDTLTGVVASSTEVDLTWVDHSANAAFGDIVYASTDGGVTFNELTEVDAVAAGATNTYAATGLTPGTPYQFYVTADDGYAESAASNTVTEPTTFVPPDINVSDTGTVVEGQPYELDLTATFEDGEPDSITGWQVNWDDGTSVQSYAASSDPTVALAVFHTFAAGTSTATPIVTAVDAASATFTATADMVSITPIAPVPSTATASGSSLNISWTNPSNISTGTTVLLSTDDNAFFDVGGSSGTSTTISDLNLDTNYWVELQNTAPGGLSAATAAYSVSTPYVAPTLFITPVAAATESGGYNLSMSATYADDTPQDDLITNWLVDFGDGDGVQNFSGGAVTEAGDYAAGCTGATISVTAVDTNGHSITQTSTAVFAPNVPTNVSAADSTGNTATVSFTATTAIAGSHYVIQRLDPGSTSGWVTVDTVAANANGDSQTYSWVDNGLTASPIGTLYRVASQGAGITASTPGSAGLSAYLSTLLSGGVAAMGSGINVSPPGLDVGGEQYVQINGIGGSNPSSVTINATGYNPSVIQVISTSSVSSSGTATILVKGLAYGTTQLVVVASNGEAGSNPITPTVPTVTAVQNSNNPYNVPTITEGVTDPSAGFLFSDSYASITPVVVPFTTFGSTIDPITIGVPSGSVTIPANTSGGSSVFYNTTIGNDGKIAPTRYAIVTLQTPQVDTSGVGGQQATMAVANSNTPGLTLNGATTNATIPLDPQGTDSGLTTIVPTVTYMGTLVSTTYTWNPNQFIMWTTDHVGTPGTDLASIYGLTPSPYTGLVSLTLAGLPIAKIYGQDISGSPTVNGTAVTFGATVSDPATSLVPVEAVSPTTAPDGTAQGVEVLYNGAAVNGKMAGNLLIGQGVTLTIRYVAPAGVAPAIEANVQVPGNVVASYSANSDQASVVSYDGTGLDSATGTVSTHFYWISEGLDGQTVTKDIEIHGYFGDGQSYETNVTFKVTTPKSELTLLDFGAISVGPSKGIDVIGLLPKKDSFSGRGIDYSGSVDSLKPAFNEEGKWNYVQTSLEFTSATDFAGQRYNGLANGKRGLDSLYPIYDPWFSTSSTKIHEYGDTPTQGFSILPVDQNGMPLALKDAKSVSIFDAFCTYITFVPPGSDSIPVYLQEAAWIWGGDAVNVGSAASPKLQLVPGSAIAPVVSDGTPFSGELTWDYNIAPDYLYMR